MPRPITHVARGIFAPMKSARIKAGLVGGCLAVAGCTTLVEVDLPEVPPQGVMEASVRLNEAPLVFLTTTQGYFDAVDASTVSNLFVGGAEVTLTVDGEEVALNELCTDDLPPEALAEAAAFLGISQEALATTSLCVYTGFGLPSTYGAVGKSYALHAQWSEGEVDYDLQASTHMTELPQLDSVWFEIPETSTNDSLGVVWTAFTDPPGFGDAYRWSSMRLGKDSDFFSPLGGVFDDAFVDGQSFPFLSFRSPQPGVEEVPGEEGFWKTGDTVVVRLDGIAFEAFEVIRDFENSVANQGNPFALPTSASTNVEGGLGWFVAYAGVTDTVVCAP